MLFFENLKNKLNKLINVLNSSINEFKRKVFNEDVNNFNLECLKVYNQKDFMQVFIDATKINLLSENDLEKLLNHLITLIRKNYDYKTSILINVITKVIFKDELNLIYTHSITYKSLFSFENLEDWKLFLNKDIKELLNRYNNSQLLRLEIRFDFITPTNIN